MRSAISESGRAGDFPLPQREMAANFFDGGARFGERERREVRNGEPGDFHRQAFRTQPPLVASRAGDGRHVLREPLAVAVRARFFEAAFEKWHDALKIQLLVGASVSRDCRAESGSALCAKSYRTACRDRIRKRRRRFAACAARKSEPEAGPKAAFEERLGPIHDHLGRIEIVFRAEPVAFRACAVGRIEAERARLELRNGNAAIGAGEFFRIFVLLAADHGNRDEPARELQRGFDGLFEPLRDAAFQQQPVHHNFDGVILAAVERRRARRDLRARHRCARGRSPPWRTFRVPSCIRLCGREPPARGP